MKLYFIYDTQEKKYIRWNKESSWSGIRQAKNAWHLHTNVSCPSFKKFNKQTRYAIHKLIVAPKMCQEVK